MKNNNLWRIIWVVGIYGILVVILYLVVLYKVKWENKDLNTYLYFYDCGYELCTSSLSSTDEYYSKVACENDICPYITEIIDTKVILDNGEKMYIYDYTNGKIINDEYVTYKYLGNDFFAVTNEQNKQGIISNDGVVVVDFKYDKINDYLDNFVSYEENGLYGIFNEEKSIDIVAQYEDVVLINDILFAYKSNNYYYVKYFNSDNAEDNIEYDFVYSYNGIILAIKDKKINILDGDLNSILLMKIDTYYEYKTEWERESLNLHGKGNYLYFSIVDENGIEINYIYDTKNKRFI